MPYKPNQIGEEERSSAYKYIWPACVSSLVSFANAFMGYDNILVAIAWGFTIGGLGIAAYGANTDEFLRSRLEVAMRFAIGTLAVYLFANWLINVADIAHSAGYALTSEETPSGTPKFAQFWTDAQTLASFITVAFFAGYVFAVLREGPLSARKWGQA